MLRRKATWIDKSVNLKQVLKDPRALRALQDFAISIHAGENVAAWCVLIANTQCSPTRGAAGLCVLNNNMLTGARTGH